MKVGIHLGLNSEICINTQFKDTLANYSKIDILTKRLALLPVDWGKNGLLFMKRLKMMIKITGYS